MEFAKKIFKWGVVPFVAFLVFSVVLEKCEIQDPAFKKLGEEALSFVKIAAYIGIAAVFGDQLVRGVLKDEIVPKVGESFRVEVLPALDKNADRFGNLIREVIEKKQFVFHAKVVQESDIEKIIDDRVTSQFEEASASDMQLQMANTALAEKRVDDAVAILSALAEKQPEYQKHLLTALVMSDRPENRKKAEKLAAQYGEASHFQKMAYRYWKEGNLPKAIGLAESGIKLAEQKHGSVGDLRNSLAYYYADANATDKADLALQYATREANDRRDAGQDSVFYAAALDTLGYVRIRFAKNKEEVEAGIADCAQARRGGTPDALFFKHIKAAEDRLAQLAVESQKVQK